MAVPSLIAPLFVTSKTKVGLTREILKVQAKAGGRVKILSILFDTEKKEWVCWYYPIFSGGGGIM